MSSFLSEENGIYKKQIESKDICKWRINEVCCNDKSKYLADFPYPFCKCENKEQCKFYEKEEV